MFDDIFFAAAEEAGQPSSSVHEAADAATKMRCKRLKQEVAPRTPSKRLKQMPGVIAITDSPGVISCTSSPETASTQRNASRNVKLEKFVQLPKASKNVKVEIKTEKGNCVKKERIDTLWNCKQEPSSPSSNPFVQFGLVLFMCLRK